MFSTLIKNVKNIEIAEARIILNLIGFPGQFFPIKEVAMHPKTHHSKR
jgi:hypothetical protein